MKNIAPKSKPLPRFRTSIYLAGFLALLLVTFLIFGVIDTNWKAEAVSPGTSSKYANYLELDVKSSFSHIRVRRTGTTRTLIFVRDSGEEAMESQIDLKKPHELKFSYLKYFFLSYAFQPKQERVLIIGLGGGSMVHFLKHYDPELNVEAIEIDPVVVDIAEKYFGTKSDENRKIVTADGFDYLARTESKYDVIYMDAFLKPSESTDKTGAPLKLQTIRFYQELQKKLTADGMVVFNLNPQPDIKNTVENIREAFPQIYVFSLPAYHGQVVVASMNPQRISQADLFSKARLIDKRFNTSFSFENMIRNLEK